MVAAPGGALVMVNSLLALWTVGRAGVQLVAFRLPNGDLGAKCRGSPCIALLVAASSLLRPALTMLDYLPSGHPLVAEGAAAIIKALQESLTLLRPPSVRGNPG